MVGLLMLRFQQTGALPFEIDFACAVCVRNALLDVHGAPVVNCTVVRMEGGIAEVDALQFCR